MTMTRLRDEVLAVLGYIVNKILSSKLAIIIRGWLKRNSMEIKKDILIALCSALVCIVTFNATTHKKVADASGFYKSTVVEETEIVEPADDPEPIQPVVDPYQYEAEEVARVLYGTARMNSEADQRAVVWCIINRCESALYPNSIEEVCRQPSQWMGYSDENPIVQDLYDVAIEELATWHSGGYRMVSPEFVFLSWSQNEIVLRTSFTENSSCRYWKAK